MQTRLARGLHERLDAAAVQGAVQFLRHLQYGREIRPAAVEVEQHRVRSVQGGEPREPDVKRQRVLIHQIEQRRQVVDHRVVDHLVLGG